MAGLPEVIGLLYRADWTRLSLSAEVRFEQDGDLARRREAVVRAEVMRRIGIRPDLYGGPSAEQEPEDGRGGYHRWRAALLIAPGRRYRLEYGGEHGGQADGSDGEQGWTLRPPDPAPLPPRDFEGISGLPVPALFRPPGLLAGFTLDVGGPVTACGRDAIAVTARPRRGAVGSGTSLHPRACNRVELMVDAETGILLRREETFEGQLLTLTELTAVTMSPPDADDPARFAPPAGSRPSPDDQEGSGPSGLGWDLAKNAAGLAAGGLGAWIRLAPHLPGHRPAAARPPRTASRPRCRVRNRARSIPETGHRPPTTCSACSTAAVCTTVTSPRSATPRCGGGPTRRRRWPRCEARSARPDPGASAISSMRSPRKER